MTLNKILAGALAVQIALAAFTWWPRPDGPERMPVVPQAIADITSISIESTSTRSRGTDLELKREGEGWVLASGFGFPVKTEKVEEMLETLTKLRYRNPISTSAARHEQLNVDEETPTRRVAIIAGSERTDLLVGAASGKRMNIRFKGQDAVYQVDGMGAWSLGDSNAVYYQKERINLDLTQLVSVRLQRGDTTFELVKEAEAWTLADLAEGEVVQQPRVREFLSPLLSLVMSNPANPLEAASDPLMTFSWVLADGTTGQYSVVGATENALMIEAQDSPPFEVASALTRQQLENTTRADFVELPPEEVP